VNQVTVNRNFPSGGLTPGQQTGAFNNAMARAMASGDQRYQMKRYDKAGFSRGGAQANQAGIQGAQDMSQGIADAYQQSLDDQHANAMRDLQSQTSQEQYAQALGGLQQQQAYAQQMAMLQRQQAVMGLLQGLLD
jgi:uncharacterized protein YbjQ (UPF0145 family)